MSTVERIEDMEHRLQKLEADIKTTPIDPGLEALNRLYSLPVLPAASFIEWLLDREGDIVSKPNDFGKLRAAFQHIFNRDAKFYW